MQTSTRGTGKHVAFRYFVPARRRATQYEEVTMHVQWAPKNYATQGYFNHDVNGRPPWSDDSTLLRAGDWWGYRDPGEDWFRPFVDRQAAIEQAIELAIAGARRSGMFGDVAPGWIAFLATHYAACRYPAYGLFMCMCYVQREALSDVVSAPTVFQAMEKDRHAQDIALYCMELESIIPGFSDAAAERLWMESPVWQPARRLVEKLLACRDWGEIDLVVNLLVEPLLSTLLTRELVLRFAPRFGDSVTPVIEQGAEADREMRLASAKELVRFLRAQDPANDAVIARWIAAWLPDVAAAVEAFEPVFAELGAPAGRFAEVRSRLFGDWKALMAELRLAVPADSGFAA
jgi:methane monooxygenase component A beta chain/propane monooxygenase small subunit